MKKTFLIAVDGSDASEKSIEYAAKLLHPEDYELLVSFVVEDINFGMLGEGIASPNFHMQLTERGEEIVEKLAKKLDKAGFDTITEVANGDPGTELCRLAEEREAAGIIIGRRGLGAVSEFLLGSVSQYVLHHAPCPVTIVSTS